jgi:hypothetical protein
MDGLIYATSIVMPDSAPRKEPVPALARWLLGLGIAAARAANVGTVQAMAWRVPQWPHGRRSHYELLMMIISSAAGPPEQSAQPPRDARLAAYECIHS